MDLLSRIIEALEQDGGLVLSADDVRELADLLSETDNEDGAILFEMEALN